VPRRSDILNPRGVESREVGGGPDFAGKIQMRRAWHSLDGNDVRQTGVSVDMSSDDVEEVDQAAVLQTPRDLKAVLFANASLKQFVAGIAHANDESVANPTAHGAQHLKREAKTVVERTAVGRIERVGQRRPELIHQMPIGLNLQPIEPSLFHALGSIDVILKNALDVPVFRLFRE
jgi:hypothetical protein